MSCGRIDLKCTKCRLCERRTQVVPGHGSCRSRIVFIGEAPGKDEDLQGRPFVGRAGRILDRTLAELGADKSDVYISNTVKCRPPGNRRPRADETRTCRPYLESELEEIRPDVICALGRTAANNLLGNNLGMKELTGRNWSIRSGGREIRLMVAYHPAACLYGKSKLGPFQAQIEASLRAAKVV